MLFLIVLYSKVQFQTFVEARDPISASASALYVPYQRRVLLLPDVDFSWTRVMLCVILPGLLHEVQAACQRAAKGVAEMIGHTNGRHCR